MIGGFHMTIPNAKNSKKPMNNQQKGKDFENKFMKWLSKQGYWAHFMHPAPDGSQPFDIIALKGNDRSSAIVYAFDCKTLEKGRFPLSRIEDNQELAFEALNKQGVHNTYFVIDCGDHCRLMPSQTAIERKRQGVKSLDIDGLKSFYLE